SPPLTFEENLGQTDRRYDFLAHARRVEIGLSALGPSFDRYDAAPLRMRFVGGDPQARPQALEPSAARSHYFRGAHPEQWIVGARHFGRVVYQRVYPGIDVAYYGSGGKGE